MIISENDIGANERKIHGAIDQAAGIKADFLLTPEGSLSGYNASFDRAAVADAAQRLAQHAKESRVGLMLGTCYKEMGEDFRFPFAMRSASPMAPQRQEFCYDQVRVYAPNGEYLGIHSKLQLVTSQHHPGIGEPQAFVTTPLRTFSWNGLCFGVLICNDLWGGLFSSSPLSLAYRLWEMGAQVIFHAVYSGFQPWPYLETCQSACAEVLRIPIVTVNAGDDTRPPNCRSGVWGTDGKRKYESEKIGDQFFSYKLSVG